MRLPLNVGILQYTVNGMGFIEIEANVIRFSRWQEGVKRMDTMAPEMTV